MCQPWAESFATFLEDMGERPQGTILERLDKDGAYEPRNCRWSARRKPSVYDEIVVSYEGNMTTLSELARSHEINCKQLWTRIKYLGEPAEVAVRSMNARSSSASVAASVLDDRD